MDLPNHLKPVYGSKDLDKKTGNLTPALFPVKDQIAKAEGLTSQAQALLDELLDSPTQLSSFLANNPDPVGVAELPETNPDEDHLVTYLETKYWTVGYPSLEELEEKTHWEKSYLLQLLRRSNERLESRGLPPYPLPTPSSNFPGWDSGYDPKFVLAVNYITNVSDKRTVAAKLQELEISSRTWNAWLMVEKNYLYYKMMVDTQWSRVEESAKLGIMREVEKGNLQAIRHYQEYTGKFVQRTEVNVNTGHMINALMEVLASTLSEQQFLEIAQKFEAIDVNGTDVVELPRLIPSD